MSHEKYFVVMAVAAFILNQDSQVLIVEKVSGDKIDAGLWAVPGGKVEPNEPVLTALAREVEEEVGFRLSEPIRWLGEDVFTHNDNGIYYHGQHFLYQLDTTPKVVLEPGSFVGYRWIGKDQLGEQKFHPNIRARLIEVFKLSAQSVDSLE